MPSSRSSFKANSAARGRPALTLNQGVAWKGELPLSRALCEAPEGSVFAWDGRVWHSAAANPEGHPRRQVYTFYYLPWMRQQENWGVTCLQEVLDEASPKLKARMGLRTYGTLGMVSGTRTDAEAASLGQLQR